MASAENEKNYFTPNFSHEQQQSTTITTTTTTITTNTTTTTTTTNDSSRKIKLQHHSKGERAIRYAEKRRTGTCSFADRVAKVSIEKYCDTIPSSFREVQRQTCIATIVAYFQDTDTLQVLSLGVGTKFVPRALWLQNGVLHRVRDCHAEILCKRAFRRYLFQELFDIKKKQSTIMSSSQQQNYSCSVGDKDVVRSILEENTVEKTFMNNDFPVEDVNLCNTSSASSSSMSKTHQQVAKDQPPIQYRLKKGVTLHLYCSSAPCGNATLKKFAKMNKETFNASLDPHEWDTSKHGPIQGHAIPFGQFSLTVKLDRSIVQAPTINNSNKSENHFSAKHTITKATEVEEEEIHIKNGVTSTRKSSSKVKLYPAQISDDWCPPGTSNVTLGKGSIHTCSDKICRWNVLGLQGALLSSYIAEPIYLSTITIARKFSKVICQRALCCRVSAIPSVPEEDLHNITKPLYKLHHPAIMGTGVYLDNSILEMNPVVIEGENVKFESKLSWAWWQGMGVECLNGVNGLLYDFHSNGIDVSREESDNACMHNTTTGDVDSRFISKLSSASFVALYNALQNESLPQKTMHVAPQLGPDTKESVASGNSLYALRDLKRKVAPFYENAKDRLLKKHPVFQDWKRREVVLDEISSNTKCTFIT